MRNTWAQLTLTVSCGLLFLAPFVYAQQSQPAAATPTTQTNHPVIHRHHRTATKANQPAQPQPQPSAEQIAAQKQRDHELLLQQQATAQRIQREDDQLVQQSIKTQQQQQNELRIQDAPGPAQTNLPNGRPATQRQADEPRVQDAPGPAPAQPQSPPAAQPQDKSTPPQQ